MPKVVAFRAFYERSKPIIRQMPTNFRLPVALATHCASWPLCHDSASHFGPAIIVFIDPHAFAANDALEKPSSDNLGSWIFKAIDIVENSMIKHLDEWDDLVIHFSEVFNKTAR